MRQTLALLTYFSILFVCAQPAVSSEIDCSEYTTNITCLMQGCNCAFLVCDTDSACVPSNATHNQPVNVDRCQSYEFCFECSHNNSPAIPRCSAGYSSTTLAQWKIAVIVLSIAFFVFMVISLILYLKMRNKKKLPKPKEVTTEYNEMQ